MLVAEAELAGANLIPVVEAALRHGVNIIQLRAHGLRAGEVLGLARQLRGLTSGRALLVVNDRADVATLSGSDGVHLGTVDNYESGRIKLTKSDSPDGQHHYIPEFMIDHVDEHVHLNGLGGHAKDGPGYVLPAEGGDHEDHEEMDEHHGDTAARMRWKCGSKRSAIPSS